MWEGEPPKTGCLLCSTSASRNAPKRPSACLRPMRKAWIQFTSHAHCREEKDWQVGNPAAREQWNVAEAAGTQTAVRPLLPGEAAGTRCHTAVHWGQPQSLLPLVHTVHRLLQKKKRCVFIILNGTKLALSVSKCADWEEEVSWDRWWLNQNSQNP